MNSAELVVETERSEESQGWLATFADLMSLLMCFFVLLLSFSELDVIKFKQLAGSMKYAFGVQRDIPAEEIPKGTSVIAQEFSPGKIDPSPIIQIKQQTELLELPELKVADAAINRKNGGNDRSQADNNTASNEHYERLYEVMGQELSKGLFELDNQGQQLVIRIRENGGFASGSGFLQPQFILPLHNIAAVLKDIPGKIEVIGHTDDLPVSNDLYSDNLELSTVRALAVAKVLNQQSGIKGVSATGMADAEPLVPNLDRFNRALNRRVEITINQGEAKVETLSALSNGGING